MEVIQSSVARSHANVRIRPRHAGVPCVRCRQMKVKCNAHDRFPAPCSGCKKAGRRCYVDPTFKRTARRTQKDTEGYMQRPQQQAVHPGTSDKSPLSEWTVLSANQGQSESGSECPLEYLTASLRSDDTPTTFSNESKSICLESKAVADLLEEYYSYYHPQFPLLFNPAEVIESYGKCPLLFWVVMAVACKHSDSYSHLQTPLQDLISHLFTEHIVLGSRSIYLVQALLLLYAWTFPQDIMNKEPSSMYCGLAIGMAKSLGLHRPQHPFRFFSAKDVEIGDLETRTRTWLACFLVDQWHTARFGVPAILRPDYTILQALKGHFSKLSETMQCQLHIAYITSKFSMILGESETSSTGLRPAPTALVRMLDTELNMLQDKYSRTWSPATEISFLDARLGLYSYILARDCSSPEATQSHQQGAEYVTLGSLAATQLLHVVSTFPTELVRGMFHTFRGVSYAVFFLLRISGTAQTDSIDKVAVRNAISQTWALMKDISKGDNDQWARMCRIIGHMIDYEDWHTETPLTGKAETFMANNFIAEVAVRGIVRARERYKASQIERASDGVSELVDASDLDLDLNFEMWENLFGSDDQLFMW